MRMKQFENTWKQQQQKTLRVQYALKSNKQKTRQWLKNAKLKSRNRGIYNGHTESQAINKKIS